MRKLDNVWCPCNVIIVKWSSTSHIGADFKNEHRFICRHSDSTVSEDAGIEPRDTSKNFEGGWVGKTFLKKKHCIFFEKRVELWAFNDKKRQSIWVCYSAVFRSNPYQSPLSLKAAKETMKHKKLQNQNLLWECNLSSRQAGGCGLHFAAVCSGCWSGRGLRRCPPLFHLQI